MDVKGFVLTLKKDIHPEAAEQLRDLLYLIDGVAQVDTVPVDLVHDRILSNRLRQQIIKRLIQVAQEEL